MLTAIQPRRYRRLPCLAFPALATAGPAFIAEVIRTPVAGGAAGVLGADVATLSRNRRMCPWCFRPEYRNCWSRSGSSRGPRCRARQSGHSTNTQPLGSRRSEDHTYSRRCSRCPWESRHCYPKCRAEAVVGSHQLGQMGPSARSARSHQLALFLQWVQSVQSLQSIRLFHPAPVVPESAAGRAYATRERTENCCRNAIDNGRPIGTACRCPVAYNPQPAPSAAALRRSRRGRASRGASSSRLYRSCCPSCRPSGPSSWRPSRRRGSCPLVRRQHWRVLPAAVATGSPGPATVVSPRFQRLPRL